MRSLAGCYSRIEHPKALLAVKRTLNGAATVGFAVRERSQMVWSEWHGRNEQGVAKNPRADSFSRCVHTTRER